MKNLKRVSYCLLFIVGMFLLVSPAFASMEACNTLGDGMDIDPKLGSAVHLIILVIQIVVPVLIVVFGSIDFLKAVIAQKEDEIKKGQQTFIKRLIAGVIVFFVVVIVRLIVSFAAGEDKTTILNCADCFLNGPDDDKCLVKTK